MKRVVFFLIIPGFLSLFSFSFAAVTCKGKVRYLQNDASKLMIKLDNSAWLTLGIYGTTTQSQVVVQANLSMALTALATDETVTLVFPDSVNCTVDNYITPATSIRINNIVP